MPPASKRNVSVVLFDMKMHRQTALDVFKSIIMHMNISHENDTMDLVLLHASKTDNNKKYSNINVACKDRSYDLNLVDEISSETIGEANWLQGISIAADLLARHYNSSGVYTLQLIFITDLSGEIDGSAENKDIYKKVVRVIDEHEIYLYIIGPTVVFGQPIRNQSDIAAAVEGISFKDTFNESRKTAYSIALETGGIISDLDKAIDFLQFYNKPIPKQLWMEPLTFDDFQFPTITTRIVSDYDLPRVKTEGDPSTSGTSQDEYKANMVNTFRVGKKLITIPSDVTDSCKTNRVFKLIGFIPQDKSLDLYFGDGHEVHSVYANPESPRAELFHALVEAAKRENVYGLAYRSYHNNLVPRLYVLIPAENYEFTMIPYPEIAHLREFEIPKKCDGNEDDEVYKEFDMYMKTLVNSPLPLHPMAQTGIYYKQLLKNFVGLLEDKLEDVEVVPLMIIPQCSEKLGQVIKEHEEQVEDDEEQEWSTENEEEVSDEEDEDEDSDDQVCSDAEEGADDKIKKEEIEDVWDDVGETHKHVKVEKDMGEPDKTVGLDEDVEDDW